MSDLVVRAFNVGFGDAVLASVPDRLPSGEEQLRHILIDVGNLLAGAANGDQVLVSVVETIRQLTGGTVDLYVMTHEHLDHVQGLLAAADAGFPLAARSAWLTASAAPEYYQHHPEARLKREQHRLALDDIVRQLDSAEDDWLAWMVRNNSMLLPEGARELRTADYVDHLRRIAPDGATHYLDRTADLTGKHPFVEAKLRILAPEADTSVYYGRRQTNLLRTDGSAAPVGAEPAKPYPAAPAGVDPGAFFDLVSSRRRHRRQLVLEIDKAANNTSLVFELEWRGWRLLFGGDAEERSWEQMQGQGQLRPVHVVKISHHGSSNGTVAEVLDTVLPAKPHDGRPRHAILSTHDNDWPSVPDSDTVDLYRFRPGVQLHDTRDIPPGTAAVITLSG